MQALLRFFVFFSWLAAHRDLHSFPTRRSSDLYPSAVSAIPSGGTGRRNAAPSPRNTSEDRKSTRLNSSHRCISYAVFCLKKKKKASARRETVNRTTENQHVKAKAPSNNSPRSQ